MRPLYLASGPVRPLAVLVICRAQGLCMRTSEVRRPFQNGNAEESAALAEY
jgi:hypothetical protein